MAEQRVRVYAELTIPTEVDLVLYDDEKASDVMDAVLADGLKQYVRDYDPDILYNDSQCEIKLIEKRTEDR